MGRLLLIIITAGLLYAAPTNGGDYLIFRWNDALFAHSITNGEVTRLGTAITIEAPDVYSLDAAPITVPPDEGYGFHHGIWSPDSIRLVYLEINPPHYRLRLQIGETQRELLTDEIRDTQGYLDPVGWTDNGEIVLLERILLNHLHTITIWRFDPETFTLTGNEIGSVGRLSGRSAILPSGQKVFLGFHLEQQLGYLLDIATGQIHTFPSQLSQLFPPAKGFQHYPLQVMGAVDSTQLTTLIKQINDSNGIAESSARPDPFLHWMLADEFRSTTCYPDSAWTTANFDVTCPGLSAPRNYVGHQGTDIGGKPDGLSPGTPVYPAAWGVVADSHRACLDDNPSCNDSYGNTVTLEHIVIVNGQVQVWYTGYGHLQTVLVEDYAPVFKLDEPLALSGATGTGGAHLHFEVRTPDQWIDPWDNRSGQSLWVGGNIRPLSVMGKAPLPVCTSITGNNIRSGPSTNYEIVGKTALDVSYQVVEITFVDSGAALGDWYRIQFEDGEGWLWSGLLDCP
jgi:murein DD-endopeptidase MepM/ murein hydrolase activator NlpD